MRKIWFLFFSKSGNVFTFTEPFLKKKILPKKISGEIFEDPMRFFLAEFFFEERFRKSKHVTRFGNFIFSIEHEREQTNRQP